MLLNNGQGSLVRHTDILVGELPRAIAVGDISGNGLPDAVVVHFLAGTVQVLLNTGGGAFLAAQPPIAIGGRPVAVALGEIDGNPGLDVATAQSQTSTLQLLANDGAGALTPRAPIKVGAFPSAVAIGDLDDDGVNELVVANANDGKATMAELSDAFIAMPGGIGTFEELFEVWTWAHLKIHAKPIGLLNVGGFFDAFGEFIESIVSEGFLAPESRALLLEENEPSELLARIIDAAASARPAPPSALEP